MTRNTKEMCQWLRDNSSGVYRPSAEAADLIEALTEENARLREALRDIIKHQEISGSAFSQLSTTVIIAKQALSAK